MVARLTLDQLVGVRIPVPQFFSADTVIQAPVAQLDRVADFESEGCRFESCRARLYEI